jgi:hypothetical protein
MGIQTHRGVFVAQVAPGVPCPTEYSDSFIPRRIINSRNRDREWCDNRVSQIYNFAIDNDSGLKVLPHTRKMIEEGGLRRPRQALLRLDIPQVGIAGHFRVRSRVVHHFMNHITRGLGLIYSLPLQDHTVLEGHELAELFKL